MLAPARGAGRWTPKQVGTAGTWTQVAVGSRHACATATDRTAWCWGAGDSGQLGDPDVKGVRDLPVKVDVGGDVTQVTAGGDVGCAVLADATARCWGSGRDGQLGTGQFSGATAPVTVTPVTAWAGIDLSDRHACGLGSDRSLWCWGANPDGQTGSDDYLATFTTPRRTGGSATWTAVSAGGRYSCALRADHSAWCWGFAGQGALGGPLPHPPMVTFA